MPPALRAVALACTANRHIYITSPQGRRFSVGYQAPPCEPCHSRNAPLIPCQELKNAIAAANIDALQHVYRAHRTDYSLPFELSTRAVGARALCGMVLQYLCATSQASVTAEVCAEQLAASNNMTDELSGACIVCLWYRKQTIIV